MNNPIIYQVVGGLLVLFFFFLIYMFTQTWRWLHITAMFFVFAASIVLCFYASQTVLTHSNWKALAREQQVEVRQLAESRDKLLYGSFTSAIEEEVPLRTLNAQLGRVILDRGRVWENVQPSPPAQDGTITVSTGADGPNRIDAEMILYAFVEVPAPPEAGLPANTKVPRFYVTEFTAAAVTDNSVTLRPTMPITNIEDDVIKRSLNSNATWSLFETMPVDGHKYFTTEPLSEVDWQLPADEEPVFGDVDPEMINRAFQPYQQSIPPEDFQNVVKSYLRDGNRANRETDPPANVWAKVRFLKNHKETVDSDAILGAVISSENFFDRGRANVPLLQRGEDAAIVRGDMGIFPTADATNLRDREIVEIEEFIYVRDLNNYEFSFRELSQRLARINGDYAGLERDKNAVTESNRRTVEQITFREDEKSKLEADLGKFQYEAEQITNYAQTLNTTWESKRQELSRLYRENYLLVQEIARLEEQMREEIDQRTLEAISVQ